MSSVQSVTVPTVSGPTVPFSEELHAQKYRSEGESFREAMNRVASSLKDNDEHYHEFREILLDMRFMPGGRIQTSIGSTKNTTPFNCYVLPIEDSFVEGENAIMSAATNAAATMRMGGGVGYDFSKLRPRGAYIKKLQSQSSGPISFMEIFDAVCRCVASSGHRRGAQMGILRCLAGSTRIHTLSNGKQPIESLVGQRPYLYAVRNGRLTVEQASCIFQSGVRKTVTVKLDNDTEIRCTPDHKFMLSDGRFVEASCLKFGDSLMAITKRLGQKGYLRVGCTGETLQPEHRMVYKALNGSIPDDYIIHHTDGNTLNNAPENLECMTRDAHSQLHYAEYLSVHQKRIASERKGKTLEEWLGAARGNEVRERMRIAKQKQADEKGTWNTGLSCEDYTDHYKNGFSNQFSAPNHKVICVEDSNETVPVYDIAMPTVHNFFAEEVCVHNCDHPSIEEFIHAKNNQTKLTGFNLSIAITDEFMAAAMTGKAFPLRFEGEIHRFVDARELYDTIMRATWDWAEPGVIFIDQVNRMNNLYYCETISATNPCSEQPLPAFGACLLGSFNLVKYIRQNITTHTFDFDQLVQDIPAVVRAMDNVTDHAIYPLPQQRAEALSKRRMGLGVTGLANAAEVLGFEYGSAEFLNWQELVLSVITNGCYKASALLAAEKGVFPLYNAKKYLAGQFIKTLEPDVKELIKKNGIRNSHLTSIAPTGTISLCADNISSGIEPVFEYAFDRTVIEFEGPRKETVTDYGLRVFGVKGKRCADVTAKEHVDVLVTAQQFMDSAVSKTCNVPSNIPWEDFKNIYFDAWQRGAKGCATFRLGGKRSGVLETKEVKEDVSACKLDLVSGKRECE